MGALGSRSLDVLYLTGADTGPPSELEAGAGDELGISITAGTPDEIADLLGNETAVGFDCVLVLDDTGDDEAITTIENIRDRDTEIPIVLFSNFDRGDIVPAAFDAGVTDTLPRSTLEERPDAILDRVESFVSDGKSNRHRDWLEEEREKYATLVEQSSDGIVVVQDEAYVFVNERFCELTGYSREQLLEMPFFEVFTPAYRELVKERYHERVAGGSPPQRYDVDVETADGDVLTLDLSVSSIQHQGATATMANLRDVTDERELEQTYREVFEGVSDGLVVHDPDTGEMCHVNEQFCALTGYSRGFGVPWFPRATIYKKP
jgi:PAS domain S-box-containing protein